MVASRTAGKSSRGGPAIAIEQSIEQPTKNRDGVDVSLVAATLSMTPEERLENNDRMVRTIMELRRGFQTLEAVEAVETLENFEMRKLRGPRKP